MQYGQNSKPPHPLSAHGAKWTGRLCLVFAALACSWAAQANPADTKEHASATAADTAPAADTNAAPKKPKFNLQFLQGGGAVPEDVAQMLSTNSGNRILPGVYQVDIAVNGEIISRRPVTFKLEPSSKKVLPCVDKELLSLARLNFHSLKKTQEEVEKQACVDLPSLVEQAKVEYDSNAMRLNISIPQANLLASNAGAVDPSLWDAGVNAAYINYSATVSYNKPKDGNATKSTYVGLQNGINLLGWRFKNDASLTFSDGRRDYRSNRSFVEHDVDFLKSQLSIGDRYTDGTIFDSVRFRGLHLASDEGMLPQTAIGYAPVVRGQALSDATVEIKQNGYILHKTTVPPGEFALRDINPSGSNGDLEIIVTEADGSQRVTYQTFASLPTMLRKDRLKYAFSVGRYENGSAYGENYAPKILSASALYGIADNSTLSGGIMLSNGYQGLNVGIGTNTPFGALSFDITHSKSQMDNVSKSGQSIRVLYSKTFVSTSTNFTLAAYRYSTEGYRTLSDHISDRVSLGSLYNSRSRSRFDLTTSQELGENSRFGSLYLNLSQQSYWGTSGSTQSIGAGYGSNIGFLSYSFSFSQSKDTRPDSSSNNSKMMQLTLSFPLGSGRRSPRVNASTSYSKESGSNSNIGISGNLTDNLRYSLRGSRSGQSGNNSFSAGMNTSFDLADVSASYSYNRTYQSMSGSASGGLVLHAGGLNLSRSLGDGFSLLQTQGVKDSSLAVQGGSSFGFNGYAVMPGTTPYRVNTLVLDTTNVDSGVELEETTKQVVPRRGAITKATFKGSRGERVQFVFKQANGEALPFGASVKDGEGKLLGFVDPAGRLLTLMKQNSGSLQASWKENQCVANFNLPEADRAANYQKVDVVCQAVKVEEK